jgi:hypothetical protein
VTGFSSVGTGSVTRVAVEVGSGTISVGVNTIGVAVAPGTDGEGICAQATRASTMHRYKKFEYTLTFIGKSSLSMKLLVLLDKHYIDLGILNIIPVRIPVGSLI